MEKKDLKKKMVNEVFKCIQKDIIFKYHISYKVEVNSQSIYFTIHRYQQDFRINIYANGNIQLKFKEVSHKEFVCDYYQFNSEDNLDELVKNLRKDIHLLLKDFIEYPMSWHVLLDYLNGNEDFIDMKLLRDNDEWIKNYKSIRKYF